MLTSNTQDIYIANPATQEDVFCGVCGAKMRATRDQHGPTSYAMAMANMKRDYDYFECPLRMSYWHQKIVKIHEFMKTVPSSVLCNLMQVEVRQLLDTAWKDAKGMSSPNQMWLLPHMHEQAGEVQEVWEQEKSKATLNGNTSGIPTERPG